MFAADHASTIKTNNNVIYNHTDLMAGSLKMLNRAGVVDCPIIQPHDVQFENDVCSTAICFANPSLRRDLFN